MEACPYTAIEMSEGRAVITEYCQDCGVCMGVCPEGAIVRRDSGAASSVSHAHPDE